MNPYRVVRDFEQALCDYTGALYAVTVTSCTMALLLAVAWHLREEAEWPIELKPCGSNPARPYIEIPKRTYVGVAMSIVHAGGRPTFRDEMWSGGYQLKPLPIWDYARRFRRDMYEEGRVQCVSFHWSKILGVQQGGAILHDDPEADAWYRRARFDGRTEGVPPLLDTFDHVGWHAYMSPEVAAAALMRMALVKDDNPDLPWDDYPDLSELEIFKRGA